MLFEGTPGYRPDLLELQLLGLLPPSLPGEILRESSVGAVGETRGRLPGEPDVLPPFRDEGLMDKQRTIDDFHKLYYRTGPKTSWMGVGIEKNPLDLWIYQEILHEIRPDLIVECGTRHGGSALYLAHLCDLLGMGRIVTVDILAPSAPPLHPRIEYLTGSSTDPGIVQKVRDRVAGKAVVMVILDSDHTKGHVLAEMRNYSPLVTSGSYMIVEDSNVNGHPVPWDAGPGPMEALEEFLRENGEFRSDPVREKLFFTFNPRGYLRKT